jgi:hypothetical protein
MVLLLFPFIYGLLEGAMVDGHGLNSFASYQKKRSLERKDCKVQSTSRSFEVELRVPLRK